MLKKVCLAAGVVAPAIYLGFMAGASTLFPGFDHARQFLSELGGPAAPYPQVFNYGLMVAGVLTLLAGLGFVPALRDRGGGLVASGLAGFSVAVFGASILIGGIFPLPDSRHLAWGMGFAVQLAPLFALLALRKAPDAGALKLFLGLNLVAVNALLAVMFGIGDLVGEANVGLWQRAYGLAMYPWIAVLALGLMRSPAQPRVLGTAWAH